MHATISDVGEHKFSQIAGCLYTYTGTEQHYCFKEIPTLNAKLDEAMPLYNVSRPCLANFPGIATMTEEEQASLCCGHQVSLLTSTYARINALRSTPTQYCSDIKFLLIRTVKKMPAVFWMRSVLIKISSITKFEYE